MTIPHLPVDLLLALLGATGVAVGAMAFWARAVLIQAGMLLEP